MARSDRTPQDLAVLADRLHESQGMSADRAISMATKIAGADDDIWQAARDWGHSGQLPTEPEVEGYRPRDLGERMSPSAAFTALMALRREPMRALSALRHHVTAPSAAANT